MQNLFVGLGFQKCATTWLSIRLRRNPHIWSPPINELHFWDVHEQGREQLPIQYRYVERSARRLSENPEREDAIDAAGVIAYWHRYQTTKPDGFASYARLFEDGRGYPVVGEITPSYVGLTADTLRKIRDGAPNAKVFVMMREPIARIWSQIRHEARLRPAEVSNQKRMLRYLESERMQIQANYDRVIRTMREVFPEQQLGYFFFEDMLADPEAYLRSICTYLGVPFDAAMMAREKQRESGGGKEPMPAEVAARARELYGHVAGAVAGLVGRVPASWTKERAS